MSDRVVDTVEIEALNIFKQVIEGEEFLFDYFFECDKEPPAKYKSKEDYMKELREEYFKLVRGRARRLLGLDKK